MQLIFLVSIRKIKLRMGEKSILSISLWLQSLYKTGTKEELENLGIRSFEQCTLKHTALERESLFVMKKHMVNPTLC